MCGVVCLTSISSKKCAHEKFDWKICESFLSIACFVHDILDLFIFPVFKNNLARFVNKGTRVFVRVLAALIFETRLDGKTPFKCVSDGESEMRNRMC